MVKTGFYVKFEKTKGCSGKKDSFSISMNNIIS